MIVLYPLSTIIESQAQTSAIIAPIMESKTKSQIHQNPAIRSNHYYQVEFTPEEKGSLLAVLRSSSIFAIDGEDLPPALADYKKFIDSTFVKLCYAKKKKGSAITDFPAPTREQVELLKSTLKQIEQIPEVKEMTAAGQSFAQILAHYQEK